MADAPYLALRGLAKSYGEGKPGGGQLGAVGGGPWVLRRRVRVLEETLSNLDAKLREELRDEIRDIQRRLGITAIFVAHDQVEALTLSDRVAVMNEGRLEQVGTPSEVYERPATEFVAAFIGRTNRIAATVVACDAGGSLLEAGT